MATIPPLSPNMQNISQPSVRAFLDELRTALNANALGYAAFDSDSGTAVATSASDTFSIVGGLGIDTSITGGVMTVAMSTSAQPLDSTLTALAAYNTDGLVTQTAADTFTGRTLTAGNGISVANGSGVAGNPTVSLATGTIVQVVTSVTTTGASTATRLPIDGTIPQITEGAELLTVTITPKATTNILLIEVTIPIVDVSVAGIEGYSGAIFQDSTANALAAGLATVAASGSLEQYVLRHRMLAGTTSSTTFRFRFGPSSAGGNTAYSGRSSASATPYGSNLVPQVMTVTEIIA